ncbi:MAG: SRPBCC family protein [Hormoscilla sp.]
MNYSKKWRLSGMLAIALAATITISSPASSGLFDGPVDRLPVEERVALRQGRVVMTGEEGEYTGRILVKAPIATAWEVLTDYNNFKNFLPNVAKSEVIQKNGNSLVFEQVNVIRVFIFTQKPRVKIAVKQTYFQQIAFRLIEGDVDSLEGVWRLEPVSPYPGAPPDRVLISNQVTVDPGNISTRDLFFSIYKKTTSDTLAAIKEEIEKRSENN